MKSVFACDGSVLKILPIMSDGPNIEYTAVFPQTAGHGGTKMHLCLVGSCFLVFLLTALTLTFNPNPNTKSEPGTNLAPVHTKDSNLLQIFFA